MSSEVIASGVVHEMPSDLRKALASSPAALAAWNDITPLARNEWICWTVTNKKPETRQNHVERVPKELIEGKRRPCCWVGCLHRVDRELAAMKYSKVKLAKSTVK